MKDVTAIFTSEKNKRENQPILLFILEDYDGAGNDLRFARYDIDVVFDGEIYLKFPITFNEIGENSQGSIDTVTITVCNVSRLIQSYLNDYSGLRGKKVIIRLVWANQLLSPTAKLDAAVYIDTAAADDTDVQFVCTTKLDILERKIPGEKYLRTHCRYKTFKDPLTCGYTGTETTCNRTKQRCKELGNYQRFGGFPSIPSGTVYVV
jgi:lambda family phage minor tail protein L